MITANVGKLESLKMSLLFKQRKPQFHCIKGTTQTVDYDNHSQLNF